MILILGLDKHGVVGGVSVYIKIKTWGSFMKNVLIITATKNSNYSFPYNIWAVTRKNLCHGVNAP